MKRFTSTCYEQGSNISIFPWIWPIYHERHNKHFLMINESMILQGETEPETGLTW